MSDWWLYPDVGSLLREYGFPTALVLLLLFRLDSTLRGVTRELHEVKIEAAKLGERIAAMTLLLVNYDPPGGRGGDPPQRYPHHPPAAG